MNNTNLLGMMKGDIPLKEQSLADLNDLLKQYPHFQGLKMLIAKKRKFEDESDGTSWLANIAIQVTDRASLFHYFNKPLVSTHTESDKGANPDIKAMVFSDLEKVANKHTDDAEMPSDISDEEMGMKVRELLAKETEGLAMNDVEEDLKAIKSNVGRSSEPIVLEQNTSSGKESVIDKQSDLLKSLKAKVEKHKSKMSEKKKKLYEEIDSGEAVSVIRSDDDNVKQINEYVEGYEKMPHEIEESISAKEMAKSSLDMDGMLVTETMAELFEIKGMNEKAIKAYQQLSLNNPEKSSFFAEKIEELKKRV